MVSPFYADFEVCGLGSGSPGLHLGLGITSFILQKMVLLTSSDALHRPMFTLQYITLHKHCHILNNTNLSCASRTKILQSTAGKGGTGGMAGGGIGPSA